MARKTKHAINVTLDRELYLALSTHAQAANLTTSQSVRDLLRHALGVVASPRDAGWREGYSAAYGSIQREVLAAIHRIGPTLVDNDDLPSFGG